jgi:hypothetical protein
MRLRIARTTFVMTLQPWDVGGLGSSNEDFLQRDQFIRILSCLIASTRQHPVESNKLYEELSLYGIN